MNPIQDQLDQCIQDQLDQCEKDIYSGIKLQNRKIRKLLKTMVGRKAIIHSGGTKFSIDLVVEITGVGSCGYRVGTECVDWYEYDPIQVVDRNVKVKLLRDETVERMGDLNQYPYVLEVKTKKAKENRKQNILRELNWFESGNNRPESDVSIQTLNLL